MLHVDSVSGGDAHAEPGGVLGRVITQALAFTIGVDTDVARYAVIITAHTHLEVAPGERRGVVIEDFLTGGGRDDGRRVADLRHRRLDETPSALARLGQQHAQVGGHFERIATLATGGSDDLRRDMLERLGPHERTPTVGFVALGPLQFGCVEHRRCHDVLLDLANARLEVDARAHRVRVEARTTVTRGA